MRSLQVVKVNQGVKIRLTGRQRVFDLVSEGYSVDLILHCAVKAFTDPVALGIANFRLTVLYALQLQVEFILVLFWPTIIPCATVFEYAKQGDFMLLKERDNLVIE